MTCRAATGFIFHALSFELPAPGGYARCLRCQGFVTLEQFIYQQCLGTGADNASQSQPVITSDAVRCALCGDPVHVDPMHRATVERFGGTCDACFDLVERIGAEPTHTEARPCLT